jgi:hypothetical protein
MQEPGLDRHEWVTEWHDLEERLADSPAEALSELDDLVARMLEGRGLPLDPPPGELDAEPETVRQFLEARRVTRRIETGETVDPGEIGLAATAYRDLYHRLLGRSSA